jgi:hypothetical protein
MKTALTHIQKLLLISAAGRESGALLLSDADGEDDGRIRSAARGLMQRRFVVPIEVIGAEYVWKAHGDKPLGYIITEAGLAAIEECAAELASTLPPEVAPYPFFVDEPEPAPRIVVPRKRNMLIAMLLGADGASLIDMAEALGWLPHTVRAALTNLRRGNYLIESEKADGVRVYRATVRGQQ